MLSIISPSNYAPFNIAAEEYILRNFAEDVFMLYINNPSIIVGKHQNTLAEINQEWVNEHQIPVVRRLTGGGSVFHDPGNLNFSFLMSEAAEANRSFERYTLPVLAVLQDLGVNAVLEGRNDMTIEGRKFSGNAKTHIWGKTLQHGTILFSSRIGDLSAALKPKEAKFSDKAVKSVRARVTNVTEHLQQELALEEFVGMVQSKVHSMYPEAVLYQFTPVDLAGIDELVTNKYATWEWNYGHSPRYNLYHELRSKAGIIEFYLQVSRGIIEEIKIYGDFFSSRDVNELEQSLTGAAHRIQPVKDILTQMDYKAYFGEVELNEIITALF